MEGWDKKGVSFWGLVIGVIRRLRRSPFVWYDGMRDVIYAVEERGEKGGAGLADYEAGGVGLMS